MDLADESLLGTETGGGDTNLVLTNKLIRAENEVNNLRNTVDSLVLAMNQLLNAFE
jgi:hypothetical protein